MDLTCIVYDALAYNQLNMNKAHSVCFKSFHPCSCMAYDGHTMYKEWAEDGEL